MVKIFVEQHLHGLGCPRWAWANSIRRLIWETDKEGKPSRSSSIVSPRSKLSTIPAAVGMRTSQVREVVQIAGDGFRVRVDALQRVLQSCPQLQQILIPYAVTHWMQMAQTAACNRLHNIEQCFARWLLTTQDRVDSPTFAITHDFLATMLGTDRPTVSLAAGMLQEKKAIKWTRSAVQILSRAKLEKCACECYASIQQDRYGNGPLRQGNIFKSGAPADA